MPDQETFATAAPAAPAASENAWDIKEGAFPAHGTADDKLRFLVGCAILAPTRGNSQPWHFVLGDGVLELRTDPTHTLSVIDSRGREAVIGCGTALYYLRLAAARFGLVPAVETLPALGDEALLARVRLRGPATPVSAEEGDLFRAIRHRRAWTRPFLSRRLPTALLLRLQTAAAGEGAFLVFLEGVDDRSVAAALAGDAVRALRENPDYTRAEAQVETTEGRTPPQGTAAGLLAELRAALAAAELPAHAAARVSRRAEEAPALAVLATPGDTPSDWLSAGQALGAVLLRADASGVEASFLNELAEEPGVRRALQARTGAGVPQTVLCLGYGDGPPPPHAPRRPVAEILAVHEASDGSHAGD